VLWIHIERFLNVAEKVIVDVSSLLICRISSRDDVGKILHCLESRRNYTRLVQEENVFE
jgi:hypothetical protein